MTKTEASRARAFLAGLAQRRAEAARGRAVAALRAADDRLIAAARARSAALRAARPTTAGRSATRA